MKIFKTGSDGGEDSGVTGYWGVEIKSLFSVAVLKFNPGSREAYHSHAFNAITWWLKGKVTEHLIDGSSREWKPSIIPKLTKIGCTHKIYADETSYALTFRGPWISKWYEYKNSKRYTLSNGRKIINEENYNNGK